MLRVRPPAPCPRPFGGEGGRAGARAARMSRAARTFLAAGGLLEAASLLAPPALSAQLIEFPFRVEEGAEFLRTVTMTNHVTGLQGEQATQETAITARLRVKEARADGSGRMEILIEEVSPPEPGDSADERIRSMVGRPLEMGLTAGGLLDPIDLALAADASDEAMVETLILLTLFGTQDRADGLLAGFPPALREDTPFVSPLQLNIGGGVPLHHTLAAVDTSGGGRIARIELRGEANYGERGSGEASGYILFDLDTGRLVESRLLSSMTLAYPDGQSMRRIMEMRTERVPG